MFRNIIESELKFPSTLHITPECKNLLTCLLKKKPNERIGNKGDAEEIKKHPWFKRMDFQRLLSKEVIYIIYYVDLSTNNSRPVIRH